MTWDEAVAAFMTHLQTQHKAGTVRNYRQTLAAFGKALPPGTAVEEVGPEDVTAFFAGRRAAGVGPGTMNQESSRLKTFFTWCEGRQYIVGNPTIERRRLKVPPRRRLRVPATDFPMLLAAAEHDTDRMAIALGIYLLIRQSEIKHLTVADVDLHHGIIHVYIEKTEQRDEMPIGSELAMELRRWFARYPLLLGRPLLPTDHLVPAKSRPIPMPGGKHRYTVDPTRPLDKVHRVVQAALERAGFDLDPFEGSHTLRRSAARALFDQWSEEGHDRALRLVQSMLHHANIAQTEEYLGIDHDRANRDRLVRGQTMYPTTASLRVVPMPEERDA